jgi:two-component system CheB/CheR fusion protein
LQDGVRRREQFLAMLSHELRNPLAAILSATRLLDAATWSDDSCREAGHVVERQAHHMARLLDDLLDVARITRGRIVLRNEYLDLRKTTHSAVEALGPFFAEHETRLVLDIDEAPIPVYGDPARLQQIQANLLSNASKYSPRGAEVRLSVRGEGDSVLIRVTDRGRGIDPDILPRIFDLFVQGRQSLARPEGGLGIGLTLLRSLVELHDGTVVAESGGPGSGSVFTVRLPLARAGAAPAAGGSAARPPVRTVVIVEDQADARRMLQLVIEAEGVTVVTAENGIDGSALIEHVRPDLALIDLGLPVMSGFDVARRIRGNPQNAGTRLVALSGYGQDADVQAALEAGFHEHLTKPPDHERLLRLLAGTDGRAAFLPLE